MHMEAIFISSENQALKTGCGAKMETDDATKAAFESLRPDAIPGDKPAAFLIDLYGDDDMIDSIAVSAESYKRITGNPVLSEAEYKEIDQQHWGDVRLAMKASA